MRNTITVLCQTEPLILSAKLNIHLPRSTPPRRLRLSAAKISRDPSLPTNKRVTPGLYLSSPWCLVSLSLSLLVINYYHVLLVMHHVVSKHCSVKSPPTDWSSKSWCTYQLDPVGKDSITNQQPHYYWPPSLTSDKQSTYQRIFWTSAGIPNQFEALWTCLKQISLLEFASTARSWGRMALFALFFQSSAIDPEPVPLIAWVAIDGLWVVG